MDREKAPPLTIRKGRGALSNPAGRFQARSVSAFDDGWEREEEPLPRLETELRPDPARSIIARNQSPDINFDQSINPYRGCEHGCIYCYARPSHAWLDLSPGLDFETRLFYKKDAAKLLEGELSRRGYRPSPIALGANTDPYQPVERGLGVTRSILEVLDRCHHPVGIVTKGALIERDLDILASMAERRLVSVMISVTTLDDGLKRIMEPRTASPRRRLEVVRALCAAGVPTGVLVAPIIPCINDAEIEDILQATREAGAEVAHYTLIRLPHELQGPVPGVAGFPLSRAFRPRHEHHPPVPRRTRQRPPFRPPHARHRRVRGPHRQTLRHRARAPRVRHQARRSRLHPFRASGSRTRGSSACSITAG